jgi:probable HAF family extracellular repeat protein
MVASRQFLGKTGSVLSAWVSVPLLLLLAIPVGALGEAAYTITSIGGYPRGINDLGQVVGDGAFIWLPEPAYGLPAGTGYLVSMDGWPRSFAFAINNQGKVVGHVADAQSANTRGFIWQNGSMVLIDSSAFSCTAINGAGDIVGGNGSDGAFIRHGNTIDILPGITSPQHTTYPQGINDLGQVVGWSGGQDGSPHAVIWQNGVPTDIGVGRAYAINESGAVVGEGGQSAFLWQNGVRPIGSLPSFSFSAAYAINDLGAAVGEAYGTDERLGHAFISQDGVMQDLNDLFPGGMTLRRATGINNSGQIIGIDATGMGFLLTPTPEPATLALMVLGGAAVAARRRALSR